MLKKLSQEKESGRWTDNSKGIRIATIGAQDTVGPREEQPLSLVCTELVTARYSKALSKRDCPS